jgi:acyl-coenzyme A synthetase/AMP-(fatty) acid ligase
MQLYLEAEVVDELSKTSTGKVKKNVLRMWEKEDYSKK